MDEENTAPGKQNLEESPEKNEKNLEKTSNLFFIITVLIVLVIFSSFFLYSRWVKSHPKTLDDMFEDQKDTSYSYSYMGFVFVNISNLWYTRIKDPETNKVYTIPLHFGPRELTGISIEGDPANFIKWVSIRKNIYVTFNPVGENLAHVALANSELSANLIQVLGINPIISCDRNETDACETVPVINCENTEQPIIYLIEEEGATVIVDKNCVIIKGMDFELLKSLDRFLLNWYGVMQ